MSPKKEAKKLIQSRKCIYWYYEVWDKNLKCVFAWGKYKKYDTSMCAMIANILFHLLSYLFLGLSKKDNKPGYIGPLLTGWKRGAYDDLDIFDVVEQRAKDGSSNDKIPVEGGSNFNHLYFVGYQVKDAEKWLQEIVKVSFLFLMETYN